jgi:hypothetical protein
MKYKTVAPRTVIPAGMSLELDEKQASLRKRFLKLLKKKDTYEVLSDVEFKAGEIIGIIGDLKDKVLLPSLSPIETKKPDAPNSSLSSPNIQA